MRKEDTFATPQKKLRFRGDLNLHHFHDERLEDIIDDEKRRDSIRNCDTQQDSFNKKGKLNTSLVLTCF